MVHASNTALWLDIDGAIGPATHDYIKRSLATAATQNVRVIIIRLNTPGGLDASMREIIRKSSHLLCPLLPMSALAGRELRVRVLISYMRAI